MKKKLICLSLISLLSSIVCQSYSQTSQTVTVLGQLIEYLTSMPPVGNTYVTLLSQDSTRCICEGHVAEHTDKHGANSIMFFLPVNESGNYVIKISNNNYHTLYYPISVQLTKRRNSLQLNQIALKRRIVTDEFELDEVTISATKLKFYFNKDTLTYDATQYITQEGFVLNNILQKMPGIEIKPNGEILSFGRKIDNLLLNGKDFFNKDRTTILDNIPAYMVKSVQIYDKTIDSTAVIDRERHLKGLTMNVKLKKEFQSTNLANLDAGGGIINKYYSKLFGLSYSPLHRVSSYIVVNNINRNETLDNYGNIRTNLYNGDGDKKNNKTGLIYNIDNRFGYYEIEGKADFMYSNANEQSKELSRINLYSSDSYSNRFSTIHERPISFTTSHKLNFFPGTAYHFSITPSLSCLNSNKEYDDVSGHFRTNIDSLWGESWIDSLSIIGTHSMLGINGINQSISRAKTHLRSADISLEIEKIIRMKNTNDAFIFKGKTSRGYNDINRFINHYTYYYTYNNLQWLNQYKLNKTDYGRHSLESAYSINIGKMSCVQFDYIYEYVTDNGRKPIYYLDLLQEWSLFGNKPLGTLPNDIELNSVMDPNNSYSYDYYSNVHRGYINFQLKQEKYDTGHKSRELNIKVPVRQESNVYHYCKNDVDTIIRQQKIIPEFHLSFIETKTTNQLGYYFNLSYEYTEVLPPITQMVNTTDDSYPLLIQSGNPLLLSTKLHKPHINFIYKPSLMNNHNISAEYYYYARYIQNMIIYDTHSGSMLTSPQNVQGKNAYSFNLTDNVYLRRDFSSKISNDITFIRNNDISYIGSNPDEAAILRRIKNYNICEEITYERTHGNKTFSALAFINYYYAKSTNANFSSIALMDYGTQLSIRLELPNNIKLNPSLVVQNRLGSEFNETNGTEHLFNINCTKSFNDNISLQLDCFDLLNQRRNIYHQISAQQYIQRETNNLGRYVMLHFIWRVNSKPKSGQVLSHEHTHEHNH